MSLDLRMTVFNKAIGQWLHDARINAGVSIEDAASCLSVNADQIVGLEAGNGGLSGQEFYHLITKYETPADDVNGFLESFGMRVSSERPQEL